MTWDVDLLAQLGCAETISANVLKVRKLSYFKFIWTIVEVLCIRHQIKEVCVYVCIKFKEKGNSLKQQPFEEVSGRETI